MVNDFGKTCPKMTTITESGTFSRTDYCDAACRGAIAAYDEAKMIYDKISDSDEETRKKLDPSSRSHDMKDLAETCYKSCGNRNCGSAIYAWKEYAIQKEWYLKETQKK